MSTTTSTTQESTTYTAVSTEAREAERLAQTAWQEAAAAWQEAERLAQTARIAEGAAAWEALRLLLGRQDR